MKNIFEASNKYWYKRVPISYNYFWLHSVIEFSWYISQGVASSSYQTKADSQMP